MNFFNKEIKTQENNKKSKLSEIIRLIQQKEINGERPSIEDMKDLLREAMIEAKMTEKQIMELFNRYNSPREESINNYEK